MPCDRIQRFLPSVAMVREHQIEIHGQAGQVPEEKIDRGSALQCEIAARQHLG